MRILTIFSLFLFFTLFLSSCQKNNDDDVIGTWQIIKVQKGDEFIDFKARNYLLTFENDSLVQLKLDVNTCNANYWHDKQAIEFQYFGCTKICCDDNLSIILIPEIKNSNTYDINDKDMLLKGINLVYLEKINK